MTENGTNSSQALSYGVDKADADVQLVRSAQQGDLNAFESLVVKYQKRMLNIAFRLLNDYEDACEIAQDAFVSAYKNIASFRGDAKFTTWLTTITLNLAKNRLQQKNSRQRHEAYSLDDPLDIDGGPVVREHASPEPSVLDTMVKRDLQAHVQECVKKLETDFREVLVLRDLQEFTYDEIGAMLKVAAGTVKSRLFRAREQVKDCLKRFRQEF
jgi:RNA polymerase sigma-70 factor (ECF subfamily)